VPNDAFRRQTYGDSRCTGARAKIGIGDEGESMMANTTNKSRGYMRNRPSLKAFLKEYHPTMPNRFLLTTILTALMYPVEAYPSWIECYVGLDSSEVVMGSYIQEFEKARTKLYIEVKAENEDEWKTEYTYSGPTKLQARLRVPDHLEENLIMFAMETSKGATFENGFCDGRRASGGRWDAEETITIDGSADKVEVWAGWAGGYEQVSLTAKTLLKRKAASGGAEL
jgi:hypothetical protein